MQRWGTILAASFLAASLLGCPSPATPPPQPASKFVPTEIPSTGPKRPDRSLKFHDRPSIPFSELHFASDDLRRRTEHFHNQADALVAKQGRADRYKDMTYSNNPWYVGTWSFIEGVRDVGLVLEGNTVDGLDQFKMIRVNGRAEAGSWRVAVGLQLGDDPRRDFETISALFHPNTKLTIRGRVIPEPFHLVHRGVSAGIEEGTLHYQLSVLLPRPTDTESIKRMLYGTPEEFLQLASEDIEALRKQAKQELPMLLTVYDEERVSSANPPMPFPVQNLKPETRAKVEAAIDARLDADLAVLKADYRDMHQAIQLALPREMFESKKESPK